MLRVDPKGPRDMVSEADVAVEQLIRGRLTAAFSSDSFLGEESGRTDPSDSTGIWVVDPIDGTQPFISGLPNWCVSIAYLRDKTPQFGLVLNPTADELFTGGIDRPALLNGQPVTLHTGRTLTEGLVFMGCSARATAEQIVPVLDRLIRSGGMYVRSGSGALGLCDVACGRLLGYVEPHIYAWDCLAAVAILRAAGATVSDYLTGDALHAGNHIIAGPPAIYPELVRVLGV